MAIIYSTFNTNKNETKIIVAHSLCIVHIVFFMHEQVMIYVKIASYLITSVNAYKNVVSYNSNTTINDGDI